MDGIFQALQYGWDLPAPVAHLVASLIADPGVLSSIPVRPHTFMKIDREIFSEVILLLPLIQEGLMSVSSKTIGTKYWLRA